MFRSTVALCSVALASAACSSSGSSADDCAPAGIYKPTATRSADPGNCPTDVKLPFAWSSITISPGERACGPGQVEISGSTTRSGLTYCYYQGTITAVASSDGITAKASITLKPCSGSNVSTCSANFDLAYDRREADAASAPDLAQPALDAGSDVFGGIDSEGSPAG